jgi:hypothetical protein
LVEGEAPVRNDRGSGERTASGRYWPFGGCGVAADVFVAMTITEGFGDKIRPFARVAVAALGEIGCWANGGASPRMTR